MIIDAMELLFRYTTFSHHIRIIPMLLCHLYHQPAHYLLTPHTYHPILHYNTYHLEACALSSHTTYLSISPTRPSDRVSGRALSPHTTHLPTPVTGSTASRLCRPTAISRPWPSACASRANASSGSGLATPRHPLSPPASGSSTRRILLQSQRTRPKSRPPPTNPARCRRR